MLTFDEFLAAGRRTSPGAIVDRQGMLPLVYTPVTLFPGGIAISEPFSPRLPKQNDPRHESDYKRMRDAAVTEAIRRNHADNPGWDSLKWSLNAMSWNHGTVVSSPDGILATSLFPALGRLKAYLHYRWTSGDRAVPLDDVIPRYLALSGHVTCPGYIAHFLTAVGDMRRFPHGVVCASDSDMLESVLQPLLAPPRWRERERSMWGDRQRIARGLLDDLRSHVSEVDLSMSDRLVAAGAPVAEAAERLSSRIPGTMNITRWTFDYYNSVALKPYERIPEDWERHLVRDAIAAAARTGFARATETGRKIGRILAETTSALEGFASFARGGEKPSVMEIEEGMGMLGAGGLPLRLEDIPEGATGIQAAAHLVGLAALDDALDEEIFHAGPEDTDLVIAAIPDGPLKPMVAERVALSRMSTVGPPPPQSPRHHPT